MQLLVDLTHTQREHQLLHLVVMHTQREDPVLLRGITLMHKETIHKQTETFPFPEGHFLMPMVICRLHLDSILLQTIVNL